MYIQYFTDTLYRHFRQTICMCDAYVLLEWHDRSQLDYVGLLNINPGGLAWKPLLSSRKSIHE